MSIGSPQPRVRRAPPFAVVAPAAIALAFNVAFAVALAVSLSLAAGCNGGAQTRKPDAGTTKPDGSVVNPTDGGTDGGRADGHPAETGGSAIGQSCTTGATCGSGFCADGVCCQTACAGACFTCAAVGSVGTCVPADLGTNPRNMCTDMGTPSCGTDGLCDGAGACENYAPGVVCQNAGCTGSTLTFAGRCDGTGAACPTMTGQSCAPFMCGTTGQCKTTCTTDADCIAPNTCNNGSCGKKPIGASCGADLDCNSGMCAQGACCSTACTGTCKSCNLTGSAGACTSVPAGQDPLQQCSDSGATTCKTNGSCDGAGACQLYPSGTVCGSDSCTGGTETVAAKCDGAGTCATGALLGCGAYICGAADCKTSCATNADCAAGYVCNGTICGKKVNGVACAAATDCTSGYCEQGVCCNTGCEATCQACNLTGTVGTCTSIPVGTDPLSQCTDMGAPSCKTNGACDGTGKCQLYPSGTVCSAQTCAGSTITPAGRCNGTGTCTVGATSSCSPFDCGAGGSCLTACGANTDCVTPNVCTASSCGKSPVGATCTAGATCSSGFCAQGYCCNSACTGTCQSCAVAGSLGACTSVPSGQDPLAQCTDAGATTCGTNGFCDGAGACDRYAAGTQCAAATCTGSTYTPASVCNGTGTCAAAAPASCMAFACDTTNEICKTSCTVNTDCTPPNVCNGTTCSLQPLSTACTTAAQCASGFCQQGVCCASACTGGCASCALAGTSGTCTNVPTGMDPLSACTDGTAATCGNDGFCDGSGKCRLYAAGTVCAAATCPSSTFTPARTCDGAGNCQTVTSTLCTPFACDTTNKLCKNTCTPATSSTDCTAPATCIGTSCGLLSLGSTCTTSASCNSGFCAQGVCCNSACTANCTSCAITSSLGTCIAVPAGQDPLNQCTDATAATCGTNGFCDGNGACQKYASGTQCIAQTCTTSTLHPRSTCNGTGTCVTPATGACTPFICGTNACKTTCTTNSDCISAAYMCSGGLCIQAVNLNVKTHTLNTANVDFVYFDIQIINTGTSPVPLSQLTVRYWYTYDTTPVVAQNPACTYTLGVSGNCASITITTGTDFVAVSPAKTNADFYFTFGFTTAAGNLAPGATAEIGPGFNKNNFAPYTQTNDYSYNASTTFTTTTTVTAYLGGALVYGTEPM
jgi:Cellulose binding domain